ncbi:MAG: PadR family transcriptional regulator [Caldisericia bacterium]|nr:PadR family transcriptional regulator [Caldisericia bacterium]
MRERFFIKRCGFSPGFWLKAWILVILGKEELHGYEIMSKLGEIFPNFMKCKGPSHMGRGYKILRMLEMEGLITSRWEMNEEGPARRVYKLTEEGEKFRKELIKGIEKNMEFLNKFINFSKEREV